MSQLMMSIKVMNVVVILLFLVGCYWKLYVNSETADNKQTAVSIVETDDLEDGVVTVEENGGEIEYDKSNVFIPTEEWQIVQPGQAVPAGLHIRLNMETGMREAKLNEDTTGAKYWKLGDKQGMVNADKKTFSREELKSALKNFKSEVISDTSSDVPNNFKSYKELKEDFEKMNMGVKTDLEIITELMTELKQDTIQLDKKKLILTDLEYYLHQYDNAVYFCDISGITILLKCLNDSNENIRSETALVIGSALQSNPKAQISALENGLMQPLIRLISLEKSVPLRKRYIYALSCLLRHFPFAQLKFIEQGGLSVLSGIFSEPGTEVLQVKIVTLLYDLIEEKRLTVATTQDTDIYRKKLIQYQKLKLKEMMVENGWCTLIPTLLQLPDHDTRENTINAMTSLSDLCHKHFYTFQPRISHLANEYFSLAEADTGNDNYFSSIHGSLKQLEVKLRENDKIEL